MADRIRAAGGVPLALGLDTFLQEVVGVDPDLKKTVTTSSDSDAMSWFAPPKSCHR